MAITCTVRSILQQLTEQEVTVSYGAMLSLRPFSITFVTEKEISLCLCKLCLDTRMLFESFMTQAKIDSDFQDSITKFFYV